MRMMHINVGCSDFDRSYDFYTQVVGLLPLTAKVVKTGEADTSVDLTHVGEDGHRIGEARMGPQEGLNAARILGFEGEGAANRSTLLYWDEQPNGPYIDLQEWDEKVGWERVERHPKALGVGRVAIFTNDLDAKLKKLEEAGAQLVNPPTTVTVGVTPMRIFCFYDPDGTLLEFVEDKGFKV